MFCAYRKCYRGLSLREALVAVKTCRDIRPNDGFLRFPVHHSHFQPRSLHCSLRCCFSNFHATNLAGNCFSTRVIWKGDEEAGSLQEAQQKNIIWRLQGDSCAMKQIESQWTKTLSLVQAQDWQRIYSADIIIFVSWKFFTGFCLNQLLSTLTDNFLQPCQVGLLQHIWVADAAGGHHCNIDILITIQHDNAVLIYREDDDDL